MKKRLTAEEYGDKLEWLLNYRLNEDKTHSYIFKPCIYCGKGDYMNLFYFKGKDFANSKMVRTCDICYTIEEI